MDRYSITARVDTALIERARLFFETDKHYYSIFKDMRVSLKCLRSRFELVWNSGFTISISGRQSIVVPLTDRFVIDFYADDTSRREPKVYLLVNVTDRLGNLSLFRSFNSNFIGKSYLINSINETLGIPIHINEEAVMSSGTNIALSGKANYELFEGSLVHLFSDQQSAGFISLTGQLCQADKVLNTMAAPYTFEPEPISIKYKEFIKIKPRQTFSIAEAHNKISNIKEYFYCFRDYDSPDFIYDVFLCVSQPHPGTRETWEFSKKQAEEEGNPVFVGHTFLVMRQKEIFRPSMKVKRAIIRNVGFYPVGMVYPYHPEEQGCLNDDSYSDFNIALKISVDSHHFTKILLYLMKGNMKGYYYNLNSNNCTTFVLDALASAGINIPRTIGHWEGGKGLNPGDLGEDIRIMKLPSNMKLITSFKEHENSGGCPR